MMSWKAQGSYFDVQEISKGDNDLLNLLSEFSCRSKDQGLTLSDSMVDFLKNTDGKGGGFAGSRLGLSNDIVIL
jgi:hypothetical protein